MQAIRVVTTILTLVWVAVVEAASRSSSSSSSSILSTSHPSRRLSSSSPPPPSPPPLTLPLSIRGGGGVQGDGDHDHDPNDVYRNAVYTHPASTAPLPPNSASSSLNGPPRQGNYEDGFANYRPPPPPVQQYSSESGVPDDDLFHESVQERVDRWRSEQMHRYADLTPDQETNPRDDQGRMKLMMSVSNGSRAVIFFCLMWRDIYLFDVADASIKKSSLFRLMARTVLAVLFCGNLAGVVASIMTPSQSGGHATKKRMKAILNLDKLLETSLLVWYFVRLTILPSKYVPKEVFIAGTLHSIFFLIQCHAFTRLIWDGGMAPIAQKPSPQQQQQGLASSQWEQSDEDPAYYNSPAYQQRGDSSYEDYSYAASNNEDGSY